VTVSVAPPVGKEAHAYPLLVIPPEPTITFDGSDDPDETAKSGPPAVIETEFIALPSPPLVVIEATTVPAGTLQISVVLDGVRVTTSAVGDVPVSVNACVYGELDNPD
jgi:hypothetical protein